MTVVAVAALVAGALLAGRWMLAMPGRSARGTVAARPEQEGLRRALRGHVLRLAGEIGERNWTQPVGLEEAARYIGDRFEGSGYDAVVERFEVEGTSFRNVEAIHPGGSRADEQLVVGAHYDTVPGSPGADDNASGVAALLEIASALRDVPLERTVRFVAFANEEPPFFRTEGMGSRAYARERGARGERIVGMLSLESIGYYVRRAGSQRYPAFLGLFYPDRGDFIGFVGNLRSRRLVRSAIRAFRDHAEVPSQGIAAPGWVPGVGWSDQWSFWKEGWPAIMVTDTAPFRNPYYHTELDRPDTLDYGRFTATVAGLIRVVRELAGVVS